MKSKIQDVEMVGGVLARGGKGRGEEGVALIIVLGFLSILLVLGMAFMVNARTERLVSDASMEGIKTRQLLRSTLAAAQNEYSRWLWDKDLYIPDEDNEVFWSEASGDQRCSAEPTLGDSGVELLTGEAEEWVPAKYRTKAVTNEVENAQWIMVRESKNGRILGRYAYVCFDTSGCLDANFVARDEGVANEDGRDITNRLRHSTREVPMGLLPEVADADAKEFKSYRSGWKGFDSLQSLVKLTDGTPNDGNENKKSSARWQSERKEEYGPGLVAEKVSELNCYSLNAYRGGRYNKGQGKWTKPAYIDPETGEGATEALSQFANIKVDPVVFGKQMKDFVSDTRWPMGTDYPSVKNVPMFNEIVVKDLKVTSEADGTNDSGDTVYKYTAKVKLKVEFWFPFPSADDEVKEDFTFDFPSISLQSKRAAADLVLQIALQSDSLGMQGVAMQGSPKQSKTTAKVEAKWNGGTPYTSEDYECEYEVNLVSATGIAFTDGDMQLVWNMARGAWSLENPLVLKIGGSEADKTASGIVAGRGGTITVRKGQEAPTYSMEVFDPRWNHVQDQWQAPEGGNEGTMGELNSLLSNRDGDQVDDGLLMYCRNAPLESPADVGFFPGSKPWRTLDIMNEDGVQFLALTCCDTNMAEQLHLTKGKTTVNTNVFYTNGTFNINSRNTNAIACIFFKMSPMGIPGAEVERMKNWWGKDPKANDANHAALVDDGVTEEDARALAKRILDYTAQTPCEAPMDWVGATAVRQYLKAQGFSKHEREAFVRNTWGCFGVADNLFTTLLIAQSVKEGPDNVGKWDSEDMVTGERRGVALVWRDPFKNGNNYHHEMMVRMFRFLND